MKAFLLKHFLVIGLLTAVVFALAIPWPGRAINSVKIGDFRVFQTIEIILIFLITGLTLRTKEIQDALRAWFPYLVGASSILFITPCAAFVMTELPFQPPSYSYGLAIFALMPTTIASGITLVSTAQGNAALAVMLTVTTNILAVFLIPFTVQLAINNTENIDLDPVSLLIKLIVTILVPIIIGKTLSSVFSKIAVFVGKHKKALGMINNGALILIVWQTLSSAQSNIVNTPFGTLVLVAIAAILLHVVYLIVNYIFVKLLCMPYKEGTAVLIMASEKTLPMAVTVIAYLPASLGASGELTVPCVIAHISQVLMDAALAQRMGRKALARELAEKDIMVIEDLNENHVIEINNPNDSKNSSTQSLDLVDLVVDNTDQKQSTDRLGKKNIGNDGRG